MKIAILYAANTEAVARNPKFYTIVPCAGMELYVRAGRALPCDGLSDALDQAQPLEGEVVLNTVEIHPPYVEPLTIHHSITVERCMALAVQRECDHHCNPGICIKCGEDQDGFEADAEKCKCEQCGFMAVYGPEELIMQGLVG